MKITDFNKLGTPIDISLDPNFKEIFMTDFPSITSPSNPLDDKYDTRADEAKEKLLQDAIAAIRDDADRVEAIIESNSDIIQDAYFTFCNQESDNDLDWDNEISFATKVIGLINRKIEYCAEADIEARVK